MNICIICVGKIKENFYKSAINEYSKRLTAYVKTEIVEVSDESEPQQFNLSRIYEIKNKEGKKILSKLKPDDYVVSLAIEGKAKTSEAFAEFFTTQENLATKRIVFVIGGSNGLSEEVYARSQEKLSFSPMTFPHQLMRVILLEQVYRAYKIKNNEPYHK